ncbi:protein argonaute 5-like [Raphanus sativus]|uniref:Protein argonaute 5-like n=1 Tax=Raphanus sativus TaxID=3726 RepID=A0A9W3CNF4_RAPSA|nr:protein argonaute 5-like [Raphanus sativus]
MKKSEVKRFEEEKHKEKTTTNQRSNEDPSSHLEDFVGADLAGVNIQTVVGDHVGKEKTTTNQRLNEDPSSHLEDFVGADLAGVNIQTVGGDHVGKEKTTTNQRLNEDPSSHLEDFVGADLAERSEETEVEVKQRSEEEKRMDSTNTGLSELATFINNSGHEENHTVKKTLRMLRNLLKKTARESYSLSGKYFFGFPSNELHINLGTGIQLSRGLFRSLRVTQDGLYLNADVMTKCCHQPIHLTQFISNQFVNICVPAKALTYQERSKVEKLITGLEIELTYLPAASAGSWGVPKHRDYNLSKPGLPAAKKAVIKGLSFDPIGLLTFKLAKRGSEVRFVDFFRKQYKRKVTYLHLPAIQIGAGEYVPMEFCRIASGQPYTQRLSEQAFRLSREQAKNFRSASVITPGRRESMIQTMIRIDKEQALKLVNKKISVSDDLTSIEARVLPPPTLKFLNFYNISEEITVTPNEGKWNMFKKKMINGASVTRWTCVNFSTLSPISATKFCQELTKMCRDLGMHIQHITQIISYDPEKIEDALREIHKKTADLQLLIVILPDMTGSYGKIKKICETELGIVSQCIRPGTILERPHLLGGKNYVLDKHISMVQDTPTIIFGADVTHPTKAEQSSLAAVVASMDWPEISTYRALVSAQTGRREIIEDLYKLDGQGEHTGMIRDHLLAFIRKTNQRPGRLIFFRDGVGETQFGDVLRFELQAIRKACSSIEDFRPKITFVLVQKRHHTRLFPAQADKKDAATGNVLPGTVVDTVICHPRQFDFFLNSHAGVMGTNRSTHYHVLLDENKFSADDLQRLTNDLCYTFAKTTNSVSLVTPVFYAHLAAFRARYYVEDEMSAVHLPTVKDEVKEKMYFC